MSSNSLNRVPSPAHSFPLAYRVSRSPSEDSRVSLHYPFRMFPRDLPPLPALCLNAFNVLVTRY